MDIGPGRVGIIEVACPEEKIALSGSYHASTKTQVVYPDLKVAHLGVDPGEPPTTWSMYATNPGTATATVTATVTCAARSS
ncbi:hypothetical protein ACQP2K_30030 [Microbispora siamensis]